MLPVFKIISQGRIYLWRNQKANEADAEDKYSLIYVAHMILFICFCGEGPWHGFALNSSNMTANALRRYVLESNCLDISGTSQRTLTQCVG